MGWLILILVILIVIVPEVLALALLFCAFVCMVLMFVGSWLLGLPVTVNVGDQKWVYRWFWRIK